MLIDSRLDEADSRLLCLALQR